MGMQLAHQLAVESAGADSPEGFVLYRNRLAGALDEAEARGRRGMVPCPTCTGPTRETVGMVCQTCGTDYAAEKAS